MNILVLVQGGENTGAKVCLNWFVNWLATTSHNVTLFQIEYDGKIDGVDGRVRQVGFDPSVLRLTAPRLLEFALKSRNISLILTGVGLRMARRLGGKAPQRVLQFLCSHRDCYDVAISYNDDLCNTYVRSFRALRTYGWVHEDYGRKLPTQAARVFAVGYLRKLSGVFCVSEYALRTLHQMSGDILRLFCFHNLLPVHDVVSTNGRNASRLLTVGRLEKVKRLDECIRVGAELMRRGLVFHWTVIGDGSQMESLKSLAQQLGVQDEFSFVGAQSDWYGLCDDSTIYVQPSASEGWGLSVEEAALRGASIVCADLQVFREIAHFIGSGRFFFAKTTSDYVEHIIKLFAMGTATPEPSFDLDRVLKTYDTDKTRFLEEIGRLR